jgi:ATP-dependent helicase/nuclease subunit A
MTSATPIAVTKSCILDASAGTGKTTQLVQRIVDAIASGVRAENIVAVTFTNAAAGEMKLRVRQKLEQEMPYAGEEARPALDRGLAELERAFIGTIHAFCAHLLRQRPVEARVDPAFEELAAPERLFARVFRDWIDDKLAEESPVLRRAFARLTRLEERSPLAPIERLRIEAWKLAEWRDHDHPWTKHDFDRIAAIERALAQSGAFLAIRNRCDRPGRDPLFQSFQPLADLVERAELAQRSGRLDYDSLEAELLAIPRDHRYVNTGYGPYRAEGLTRPQVLAAWDNLKSTIDEFRAAIDADFAADLRDELWEVVERYEQAKIRAGQLDFLDLLLCARRLLDNADARSYFRERYPYVFIDEFQDTDPVQADVLRRIWTHVVIAGDRKQSIYRFRRADVEQYRKICSDLESNGAGVEQLDNCARSTTTIQQFVNAAFSQMPEYLPLRGGREPKEGQPSVLALPMPKPYGTRNLSKVRINECSPTAVAAFIEWLVESGWSIWDKQTSSYRRIRPGDVCILFRRFTNNGVDLSQDYVRALEARGLAHVLIGSKSFNRREEVAVIRTALSAIEWPGDELSVYATLRNLFGIWDSTLFKFRNGEPRHSLNPFSELPGDLDAEFHPIREAFALLKELHRRRNARPIAQTINDLLVPLRGFTTFAFRKGGKRVLANIYRLLDIARSFEITEATSFRSFIHYLEEQAEGGEAKEAPILEQEADAVKLINVHKAKGLEFPVVILADLTANLVSPGGSDRFCNPDRRICAQRLLGCAPQDLIDNMAAEDEAERAEALRLAYVAATRARDLLVVSAVGDLSFSKKPEFFEQSWLGPLYPALYPKSDRWRIAESPPGYRPTGSTTVLDAPQECAPEMFLRPGLHFGSEGNCEIAWFDPALLDLSPKSDGGLEKEALLKGSAEQEAAGLHQYESWKAGRRAMIESGQTPSFRVIEAVGLRGALPEGLPAPQRIKVEAPDRTAKGRKFGRVVHRLLQTASVPLNPSELEKLAPFFAKAANARPEEASAAVAAVVSVFQHELIRSAVAAKLVYRELPVSVRLPDGQLVEGRADLVYFDGESWIVVDFKTGSPDDNDESQIQIYAYALSLAKAQPVRAIILEI